MRLIRFALAAAALAAAANAPAQRPDFQAIERAQREAMEALRFLDGTWRGPARTLLANGQWRQLTQTERIGSFLQGAVKVVEGRGYLDDGSVAFNALGIISWDPAKKAYSMRSYALGHSGDFPLTVTADGFAWEIAAGPNARIRYVATVRDGTFHEVGERVVEGQPPQRILEMTLKRLGDTAWPAADAVPRN